MRAFAHMHGLTWNLKIGKRLMKKQKILTQMDKSKKACLFGIIFISVFFQALGKHPDTPDIEMIAETDLQLVDISQVKSVRSDEDARGRLIKKVKHRMSDRANSEEADAAEVILFVLRDEGAVQSVWEKFRSEKYWIMRRGISIMKKTEDLSIIPNLKNDLFLAESAKIQDCGEFIAHNRSVQAAVLIRYFILHSDYFSDEVKVWARQYPLNDMDDATEYRGKFRAFFTLNEKLLREGKFADIRPPKDSK